MGFKDSRLGKIFNGFSGLKSLGKWLKSVDDESLSVEEAVREVNKEAAQNGDAGVSDKAVEAMEVADQLSDVQAKIKFDRDETVGPVFSAAEDPEEEADKETVKKLNEALLDDTMRYVNGNPVELRPVEAKPLEKGGKEREKIR